jgi:hypothetical protein
MDPDQPPTNQEKNMYGPWRWLSNETDPSGIERIKVLTKSLQDVIDGIHTKTPTHPLDSYPTIAR